MSKKSEKSGHWRKITKPLFSGWIYYISSNFWLDNSKKFLFPFPLCLIKFGRKSEKSGNFFLLKIGQNKNIMQSWYDSEFFLRIVIENDLSLPRNIMIFIEYAWSHDYLFFIAMKQLFFAEMILVKCWKILTLPILIVERKLIINIAILVTLRINKRVKEFEWVMYVTSSV